MLVGLGALLLLGGGKGKPKVQETITGSGSGFGGTIQATGSGFGGTFQPTSSGAFDIQSYIATLFSETATVPVEPPVTFFYPKSVVVTSSGVPAVVNTAPEIITDTTKVQVGGEGGETIVESALVIKRREDIAKQQFAAAANSSLRTSPVGAQYFYAATVEANRIEEARQKQFAADLIAERRAAQSAVVQRTRLQQENIAKGLNPDGSRKTLPIGMSVIGVTNEPYQPTINFDEDEEEFTMNTSSLAGQDIVTPGVDEFSDIDFTQDYSDDSFVIAGGMGSPTVYASAQYDIGF